MSDPRSPRAIKPSVGNERSLCGRGRYFTIEQATQAYPAFTMRLLRRLVQERRIPFSRVGRRLVFAEADIEEYFEHHRVEPPAVMRNWRVAS